MGFFKKIRELIKGKNKNKEDKKPNKNRILDGTTPYIRKEVHSKFDFDKFYKNNDFCIECVVGDKQFCQVVANLLNLNYDINTPVNVYVTTGKDLNKAYDLAGDNAYQNDTHHVIIPLDTLRNISDSSLAKETIKARYFNDVVDNNEYREYLAGRHKASKQIQWIIDYYAKHQ